MLKLERTKKNFLLFPSFCLWTEERIFTSTHITILQIAGKGVRNVILTQFLWYEYQAKIFYLIYFHRIFSSPRCFTSKCVVWSRSRVINPFIFFKIGLWWSKSRESKKLLYAIFPTGFHGWRFDWKSMCEIKASNAFLKSFRSIMAFCLMRMMNVPIGTKNAKIKIVYGEFLEVKINFKTFLFLLWEKIFDNYIFVVTKQIFS